MSNPDQDEAVLGVPSIAVKFRGETLTVTPLTLLQISPFITAARGVIGRAVSAVVYARAGAEVETGAVLLDLLEQDAPAVAAALSVVTGREADWLIGGTLTEVGDLVGAVVELNRDFFAQGLPALVQRAGQAIPPPAGQTSSSTSSPADTVTPSS